jgi:CRISPR-associated endonuclease Cas1
VNMHLSSPIARNGILALSGYGIRVAVERGHLHIEDGVGLSRRRARFARASAGFNRLVVTGHSGIISLEALRWLHGIGAAFIQIDRDGQLIYNTSPFGFDDARLRRAQAFAISNGLDLQIGRDLVSQKLAGQVRVTERLRDSDSCSSIRACAQRIEEPDTIDALRTLEAMAASIYWKSWENVGVTFVARDRNRVPEHWLEFGGRASLLTGMGRKATNPANAILNYLYAILESEALIAAMSMGLDPGMGFLHTDERRRNSLACDLMEAVRPLVDSYLLDMLAGRAFKKEDFFETREGVCRVMPSLTGVLMTTAATWTKAIKPIVERLAQTLLSGDLLSGSKSELPRVLRRTSRRGNR